MPISKGMDQKTVVVEHNGILYSRKKGGAPILHGSVDGTGEHYAKRHKKGCSASLVIREMQIKTIVRYQFTPVRMAIINKSTNNKCW